MDLVECEAPLDNSFQKDRLELVNKGSLGRRRKPSRSNLRLILSPSNERQIIDVFHNHQPLSSDGSFIQEKVSPTKILTEPTLDNHPKSVTRSHLVKNFTTSNLYSGKKTASENYREVVGSIKQIYSNNCLDLNGNNERTVSSVNNRLNFSSTNQEGKCRNNQENCKSKDKNTVNFKYHSQFPVTRNEHNGIACEHQKVIKLANGHLPNKFKHYENDVVSKNQKVLEYKNHYVKLNNGQFPVNDDDDDPKNQKISEHKNNFNNLGNGHLPKKSNHHEGHSDYKNQKEYANHRQTINRCKLQETPKIHQNIITFSNHRQIVTSPIVQINKPVLTNGYNYITTSQDYSSKSNIETSLPRTSKEPSLVEEAQQFSIEAKLKRRNSDAQGRSAVLIQTWERRTQSESHSKSKKDCKTTPKNRFSENEICDTNISAMPDSYICTKYKGSLQNGDSLQKGGVVSYVRDMRPDETMLYRVPEDGNRTIPISGLTNDEVTVNGNSNAQEPEWISLSRKLCAKFVEGHIEPNSPDSYPYEEPEGVGEDLISSPLSARNRSGSTSAIIKTETQIKKTTPSVTSTGDTTTSNEPPWIHLSRKLCNKFIEEHIEYPPITNGHFVEVPELVEPNGDVRIIEKIGKPKGHKSKQKKEYEPEWVSLSKKLRAKFIESHIDDPDTIALDNQLNASDPEETGSESLSDFSQDTAVPKEFDSRSSPIECKNYMVKDQAVQDTADFGENYTNLGDANYDENSKSSIFPEKECCWEYQEMEFDQESNSGNFQETEYDDRPLVDVSIQRVSLQQDPSSKSEERVTFPNSVFSRNYECYNNDVNFIPCSNNIEGVSCSPEQNKLITVQFIAHSRKDQWDDVQDESRIPCNNHSTEKEAFFNFSPWEVPHYQKEEVDDLETSEEIPIYRDFRSKSLDNLCDSLEESSLGNEMKRLSTSSVDNFDLEQKFSSEKQTSKKTNDIFFNKMKVDFETSCDVSLSNEDNCCDCTCERGPSKSSDNMACSDNFLLREEKETFCDKNEIDSSSEDEVFEYVPEKRKQLSSSSQLKHSRKIPSTESLKKVIQSNKSRKSSSSESSKKEMQSHQPKKISSPENLKSEIQSNQILNNKEKARNDHSPENGKSAKCNGMIPNSIYDPFLDNKTSVSKHSENNNAKCNSKEPVKMGMSKWITMSKSEQNISKPEYSNVQSIIHEEQKTLPEYDINSKDKLKKSKVSNKNENEDANTLISKVQASSRSNQSKHKTNHLVNENTDKLNISPKTSDLKTKCKSLCDISRINNSLLSEEIKFSQHGSIANLCSTKQSSSHHSEIEFQHFENDSEIPLCAKLVSNQDKKISRRTPSVTPSNRTESPCPSDTSHVYEDMFKETPSVASDSEPSSWTVLKHNTYHVNGRSSSMNDLDFSDSCSMSVKCDYASSSESGTWQSRHSSYASSSFYVNLRDYDSHMMEPKNKKSSDKITSNGKPSNASKSSPPTPESLRQLFTSPLTSIHSTSNNNSRMLNRMPSDPQSHYYSTAVATSSAFKHGFAQIPAKTKKTERSSSMKIKDIAHGILLTFRKLQNHSKSSNLPSTQHVDVSHLAELKSNSELGKTKRSQKDSKSKKSDKNHWEENGKSEFDSRFLSDVQRMKARRSSSDLTDWKSNSELFHPDKKKSKKKGGSKDKGKKSKGKDFECRTVPTVSRKVQQMADGTLYLVTTVSGDSTMPGVYSDSPDTSSELSSHRSVKNSGESNC